MSYINPLVKCGLASYEYKLLALGIKKEKYFLFLYFFAPLNLIKSSSCSRVCAQNYAKTE